jgi:hypothetical protein
VPLATRHSTKTRVSSAKAYVDASVSLSARVTGRGSTPTGTVTFTDGRHKLCSARLSRGRAHCSAKFTGSGTHHVKGSYGGNSSHKGSSGTATVKVSKAPTKTTVTASPANTTPGHSVTLTAKVSSTSSVRASGHVTFSDSSGTLCSNVSLSGGKATCSHSFTTAATYAVTAKYAGNSAHSASSGVASVAVAKPALITTTTTIMSINPGTVQAGVSSTITVTVTAADHSTATGTVRLAPTDVNTPIDPGYECTVTLAGGTGSCQVTPPNPSWGQITYEATYAGDTTHATSVSTGTNILNVPATTTTTLTSGTATAGNPVTLTATVINEGAGDISPASGGTGTVTFTNGGTTLCANVALTYSGGGVNVATCTVTFKTAGSYGLKAAYSGDEFNDPSSGTETITVGS